MNIRVKRQGILSVPYIRPTEIIKNASVYDLKRCKAHLK
jgi:hypothetical protein